MKHWLNKYPNTVNQRKYPNTVNQRLDHYFILKGVMLIMENNTCHSLITNTLCKKEEQPWEPKLSQLMATLTMRIQRRGTCISKID